MEILNLENFTQLQQERRGMFTCNEIKGLFTRNTSVFTTIIIIVPMETDRLTDCQMDHHHTHNVNLTETVTEMVRVNRTKYVTDIFVQYYFLLQYIETQFLSVYRAQWVTDPFAPKFLDLLQHNIGPNIGDGLNFVIGKRPFFLGKLKVSNFESCFQRVT